MRGTLDESLRPHGDEAVGDCGAAKRRLLNMATEMDGDECMNDEIETWPLDGDEYGKDCLELGPLLVGKLLVRTFPDGTQRRLRITETEAYRGAEDTACHARMGRTKRNDPLWSGGGTIYVYLCYGIHWLLNIVSGQEDIPQAVLIRACEEPYGGPGKLTKALAVDKSFNGLDIRDCPGLRIEDDGARFEIIADRRVGIGYASEEDQAKLWRFRAGERIG